MENYLDTAINRVFAGFRFVRIKNLNNELWFHPTLSCSSVETKTIKGLRSPWNDQV
jgi:hypothetical protein